MVRIVKRVVFESQDTFPSYINKHHNFSKILTLSLGLLHNSSMHTRIDLRWKSSLIFIVCKRSEREISGDSDDNGCESHCGVDRQSLTADKRGPIVVWHFSDPSQDWRTCQPFGHNETTPAFQSHNSHSLLPSVFFQKYYMDDKSEMSGLCACSHKPSSWKTWGMSSWIVTIWLRTLDIGQ